MPRACNVLGGTEAETRLPEKGLLPALSSEGGRGALIAVQ